MPFYTCKLFCPVLNSPRHNIKEKLILFLLTVIWKLFWNNLVLNSPADIEGERGENQNGGKYFHVCNNALNFHFTHYSLSKNFFLTLLKHENLKQTNYDKSDPTTYRIWPQCMENTKWDTLDHLSFSYCTLTLAFVTNWFLMP